MNDTQLDFKFKISKNEEYVVDNIWDSIVYTRKLEIKQLIEQLLGFYYLVL